MIDKKFKTIFIGVSVLFVLSSVVWFSFLIKGINSLEDKERECKDNIGKYTIIDGDTLTVVDYSLINQTYTLSNGINVSFELIEK